MLFCLGIAIDTAIFSDLGRGKAEDLVDPLLRCCDTTGVFASQNIRKDLGQRDLLLLHYFLISDDTHRCLGTDEADKIHIKLHGRVDLDDILLAQLGAVYVLQYRNRALQSIQPQHIVKLHSLPCGNMVDDDTVFDAVNSHMNNLSFRSPPGRAVAKDFVSEATKSRLKKNPFFKRAAFHVFHLVVYSIPESLSSFL